jgi:ribosomal protein S7
MSYQEKQMQVLYNMLQAAKAEKDTEKIEALQWAVENLAELLPQIS